MSIDPPGGAGERKLFIKMVIAAWDTHNTRVTELLNSLSDEILARPTSAGRNSGHYLLGHLVAVSDGLLPLLGLGERLYPELDTIFLHNAEQSGGDRPSISTLRQYWKNINEQLSAGIGNLSDEDWFTRHSRVSPEDFAREPFRNKLNVIINRTNHTSYHLGQLVYLLPKQTG